ncbi:MAG: SdpI family protein [Clostridia bacterium]|nr:SdpI family protein [Clostridia bacterium]
MIKKNLKKIIFTSIVTLLPIIAGLLIWDKLPDEVPTHFGPDGMADGWSSKPFAVFGMPLMLLGFHLLCIFGSSLDPKHKNINSKMLTLVLWICPVISILVSSFAFCVSLGYKVNVTAIMMLFVAATFIIIGNYLPKCRQNYTVGIKIPWTLNDEENWDATHRFAGKLWVIGGVVLGCFSFFKYAWIVFIAVVSIMIIVPFVYSYLFYKKRNS